MAKLSPNVPVGKKERQSERTREAGMGMEEGKGQDMQMKKLGWTQ